MKPLISVIIPAYNIENYIERCLKSICEQTYTNLEIIVVDDGSTDKTGEILDKIAKLDDRIIPIHKQNTGVSAARNTGLDRATGDYIGFVDGDDVIDDDMYELLINNAIKYDADISHCGYKMVFPDRVDYYYNTGEVYVQNNYQGVYDLIKADKVEPGIWNKLYKRQLIKDKRLNENIKINEDLLFNYYLFKESRNAVFQDVAKYHYVIRSNSASTSSVNMNKIKDPITVVNEMMKQESGELFYLLEKRYLYILEKISIISDLKQNEELLMYQEMRRNELRELLNGGGLKASYTKKEMFQMKLAAICPWVYRAIHDIYARFTGSKDKYRV